MQHIREIKDRPLSPELVFELHRRVTDGTLKDPSMAGRFRRPDEPVVVGDDERTYHRPPVAEELEARMTAMCDFANGKIPDYFIHPVLRSIVLHFWLAYDHPFIDGNGRTARTLFYWSMLHHGFWLFEFVSISRILRAAPSKYGTAFLYTETDDNDLTYFILHQLEVIRRAVKELDEYLARKAEKDRALQQRLRGIDVFNHRQRALLGHALRHPHSQYTIKGHQTFHDVVYETARTDLLQLAEQGILDARKIGKVWYYTPADNLGAKLAALS
jgi:Fic family protein